MKFWHKILLMVVLFGGISAVAQAQNYCSECGAKLTDQISCQPQAAAREAGLTMGKGRYPADGLVAGEGMGRRNRGLAAGMGQGMGRRNGQAMATRGRGLATRQQRQQRAGMGPGRVNQGLGQGMGRMNNPMAPMGTAQGRGRQRANW